MVNMNLSLNVFITLTLLLLITPIAFAQEQTVSQIHFFEQRGCPDCAAQKTFLDEHIAPNHPDLNIISYSIMSSQNQEKFHQFMAKIGVEDYNLVVPTLFIGDNYFQNFYEEDKDLIIRAIKGENVQDEIYSIRNNNYINIPLFGQVDMTSFSLPALALVIGTVDGLNVCSIGALILILSLVLAAFKSRKKILLFGGLFILTTTLVYGVLIFAWTALFHSLAKYIGALNIFIGLASIGGGIFFFKKFIDFYRYGPSCEYSSNKYLLKVTKKLKDTFSESERTIAVISGIILFAFVVTIVELPCSFGLPMIYAGILATSELATSAYIFYVLLYLFFYMLVELLIFTVVVITKEMYFVESNWITWVYLFGSLVLLILGYSYLIGF